VKDGSPYKKPKAPEKKRGGAHFFRKLRPNAVNKEKRKREKKKKEACHRSIEKEKEKKA